MKKITNAVVISLFVAAIAFLGGCACCGDAPKCHEQYGGKCN